MLNLPGNRWLRLGTALLPAAIASGVLFSVFHGRLRRTSHEVSLRKSVERLRENNDWMQLLLKLVPEGIVGIDANGRCLFINPAGLRLLGYDTPAQLVGSRLPPLIDSSQTDDPAAEDFIGQALRAGCEQQGHDGRFRRADGSSFPIAYRFHLLHRNGHADGALIVFRDIGADLENEERQRQAAIVFANTAQAVVVTDPEARIVRVNKAYTAITGYRLEEVLGKNPRLHQSGRHDKAFYKRMWDSLIHTGQWQGEIWNRRKNGEIYPAWENISVVQDEHGRVSHYVALLSDITIIKQAEEKLRHMAHHDSLSGLPNRLLFDASLRQALERAKRNRRRVALLFLDLDRFKLINDSLGHAAGDRVLQTVAERLRSSVRAEDLVARLGGDEFTLILEQIGDPLDSAHLACKLIETIAKPIEMEGIKVQTSTSIGIGLYPDDATNAEDLMLAADTALYRAKARGRSTFEFYSPEITAAALEHLTVELRGWRHEQRQSGSSTNGG